MDVKEITANIKLRHFNKKSLLECLTGKQKVRAVFCGIHDDQEDRTESVCLVVLMVCIDGLNRESKSVLSL